IVRHEADPCPRPSIVFSVRLVVCVSRRPARTRGRRGRCLENLTDRRPRIVRWPSAQAVGFMRVFMLGWEFPPFISGGLGTACYGLTKAMSSLGTDVMFVLPRPVSTPFSTHVRLVSPRPGSPLAAPSTEFRLD